jgi:vacuolar-type H+-ATPase subunit F/Vma7
MTSTIDSSVQNMARQEVAIIGDGSMVMGFRLAGVKDYSVVGPLDQGRFDSELSRMLGMANYSVIIVGERHLSRINPALSRRLLGQLLPVVIAIPDKEGPNSMDDPLKRLLKRSLGIDMGSGKQNGNG